MGTAFKTPWRLGLGRPPAPTTAEIGREFMGAWLLPFEAASILPTEVAIERSLATAGIMQAEAGTVVVLDPTIDEALREEGLARELVNRIQRLRKDAGYDYTARVAVALHGDAALEAAARRHAAYLQGETLARELSIGQALDGADLEQDVDIDGRAARLGIARLLDGRPAATTPHLERQ